MIDLYICIIAEIRTRKKSIFQRSHWQKRGSVYNPYSIYFHQKEIHLYLGEENRAEILVKDYK